MRKNLYEQLSDMTVIVADTGDLYSIEKFKPRDATTNPSLITAAAQMEEYSDVVDAALSRAREEVGNGADAIVSRAIDRLSIEFGLRILDIVSGRVSTEVDARLSYDMKGTIAKAYELIGYYEEADIGRDRVLIKIAATWEGICAAEQLEKDGIHCNLTLLFGIHQAVACAQAEVTLVSPFVGRILDWYKSDTGKDSYAPDEDPGVISVTDIYNYYKRFDYKTEVMGASFRNLDEVCELAGCDLLTISPNFLAELRETEGVLPRKLDPANAATLQIDKIAIDEAAFRQKHEQDRMSNEKLSEGITGFSSAIVALERLLANRLAELDSQRKPHRCAEEIFAVFDMDGDGTITREEWTGTDAVFNALDIDGDGRITPRELAAGIGFAFCLNDGERQ